MINYSSSSPGPLQDTIQLQFVLVVETNDSVYVSLVRLTFRMRS